MAQDLTQDEWVYLPRARLGIDLDAPSALWRTRVREVVGRSIRVDLPGGQLSGLIASSAAHRSVGIAIIRIGDLQTEPTLLDPLAKSLLQYCRLLLPDDQVILRELRSRTELRQFWILDHATHSHLILIGHGRANGIRFGTGWVAAEEVVADLGLEGVTPKVIMSLCCKNGYAEFSGALSRAPVCRAAISPFDRVHGAVASQFAQTFLAYHFLHGETLGVAFRHARQRAPGATSFRLWTRGHLTAGPT